MTEEEKRILKETVEGMSFLVDELLNSKFPYEYAYQAALEYLKAKLKVVETKLVLKL